MITPNRVVGVNPGKHNIMLYTLSTCIWCKKTKALLGSLGVSYEFIDMDTISGRDNFEAMSEMRKFNPSGTYPTMVIDGSNCIVGFKEAQIRETLYVKHF